MEKDLEYSVTRIFLSQRSVRGIKVLLISLMAFALLNLITVIVTSGQVLQFMLRVNLIVLFGGLTYFFRQISEITRKDNEN